MKLQFEFVQIPFPYVKAIADYFLKKQCKLIINEKGTMALLLLQ